MKRLEFIALFALVAVAVAAFAEPPVERVIVVAVADHDADRVLVRWRTLEGTQRYDTYHVHRRHADETSWIRLNDDPIAPLTDAASIEAVFTAPGRADALAWIQETLGPAYPGELLRLQSDDAGDDKLAQRILLPDQNYGAALAMGLGFLDETVVAGETYVYEVWGADGQGFAIERLGRASATAGQPGALSAPVDLDCAKMGDQRSHAAAFMRWTGPDDEHWLFGYEVLRAETLGDGTCPDFGPGFPGVVRAHDYPVLPTSAGAAGEGAELFAQDCQGCHAAPDPRAAPPGEMPATSGVEGGTLRGFRRRMNSDVAGLDSYPHDTASLRSLKPETLQKVFDWIQEFLFRDDGDATPQDPLQVGEHYCYRVFPRDLLGQLLASSDVGRCEVQDLMPPEVPAGLRSERLPVGDYETCRISWDRNDSSLDGTEYYEVLRVTPDVPRNAYVDTSMILTTVGQPPAAGRVVFDDTSLTSGDARQRFFYAARARDAAGNVSPASAWAPCVPRDLVPPPAPSITKACCDPPGEPGWCTNTNTIPGWIETGGDDTLIVEPRLCKPRLDFDKPGDTYGWRVYRSFDGATFRQIAEVTVPWYDVGFQPTLDQKVWFRVEGYDSSGNRSGPSNVEDMLLLGSAAPPAPKILDAVHAIHGTESFLKVTFRSLPPRALLGFAFYKNYFNPDEPFGGYALADPPLMVRYHDSNLGVERLPGQERWAVREGAATLDHYPEDILEPPVESEPYLYFDELFNRWRLQVPMAEYEMTNLVITLKTIGWTGVEGAGSNFVWNGLQSGDLDLDWPAMPDDNFIAPDPGVNDVLTVQPQGTYPNLYNVLSWNAYPDGCDDGNDRPFVIYRRRGSSPRWKQISPLFSCSSFQGQGPLLTYNDTDVESGFEYSYIVIRFDRWGEFAHRFGPAGVGR